MALRAALCRSPGVARIAPNGLRLLASNAGDGSVSDSISSRGVEWRKQQLDKLEKKFSEKPVCAVVESYEDVQPMWKGMESRVTNRKPLTKAQRGGRIGRMNVRKTEEDVWLKEGLYDDDNNEEVK